MKKTFTLLFVIITLFSLSVNAKGILDDKNNIYSDYVYMVNLDTDKVVYEYEADTVTYPASLTKIMTCILAIEHSESLDDTVIIPSGLFDDVYSQGGANIALKVGEEISVRDLICATMIRSACDSASALAYYVSGSVEEFASLMNKKAEEIGCTSTHFVNAHGLHDKDHYTTAKDMYIIAKYALQNEIFCDIISQYSGTIPATNKSDERNFLSTIEIEIPDSKNYYEYVTGVKSGFTDEAGRCLVTKATKNGETYLLVTLGANRDRYYNSNMAFTDAVTLFEYCFAEYDIKTVVSTEVPLTEISVSNSDIKTLSLYPEEEITALLPLDYNPTFSFDIPKKIKAPIKEGQVIGSVTISVDGEEYTTELVSKEKIESLDSKRGLERFNNGNKVASFLDLSALVIFLVAIIILAIFILKIRKKR